MDAILGPYSSPIIDAVADVSEKHKMPMVAPSAGDDLHLHRKGRRFIFMVFSPGEVYLEGLIDMAAKRGLKTVALVYEDTLFPQGDRRRGPSSWRRSAGSSSFFSRRIRRARTDFSADPHQGPDGESRCARRRGRTSTTRLPSPASSES